MEVSQICNLTSSDWTQGNNCTIRPANPWWEVPGIFPFKTRDFGHQPRSFSVKREYILKNDINEIFAYYIIFIELNKQYQ